MGRPKIYNYEIGYTVRMAKADMAKLRFDHDRYLVALGSYDKRGNQRSFNEYLLKKLKA